MNRRTSDMPEIGIVETRNIIRAIQQKYGYDFSQYTLASFRFALDRSILRHHLRFPELLMTRIHEDDDFFDEFLFDISESSVELFRDSETWNILKSRVLPQLFDSFTKPKIWLPASCCGQDLFSLLILLNSEFPKKNITIIVSALSEKILEVISRRKILTKQVESSLENYERVFPHVDIYNFLKPNGKDYTIENSSLQEISYIKQNLFCESIPESAEMIIFRNKLIDYNSEHQKSVLDRLTSALRENGYLFTGIKENINDYISDRHNLKVIDKSEKIYKKII